MTLPGSVQQEMVHLVHGPGLFKMVFVSVDTPSGYTKASTSSRASSVTGDRFVCLSLFHEFVIIVNAFASQRFNCLFECLVEFISLQFLCRCTLLLWAHVWTGQPFIPPSYMQPARCVCLHFSLFFIYIYLVQCLVSVLLFMSVYCVFCFLYSFTLLIVCNSKSK